MDELRCDMRGHNAQRTLRTLEFAKGSSENPLDCVTRRRHEGANNICHTQPQNHQVSRGNRINKSSWQSRRLPRTLMHSSRTSPRKPRGLCHSSSAKRARADRHRERPRGAPACTVPVTKKPPLYNPLLLLLPFFFSTCERRRGEER